MQNTAKSTQPSCQPCGKTFPTPVALRLHRRRQHALEIYIKLENDVTVSVLRVDGKFRCPIVGCLKDYATVDTFHAHSTKIHNSSVSVAKHDEEPSVEDSSTVKSSKRQKLTEGCTSFSLSQGSQNALNLETERRAFHTASSLDCEPLALHFSHKSMNNPFCAYGLFQSSTINDIGCKIPFESTTLSSPVNCTVQLHTEEYNIKPTSVSEIATNTDAAFLARTVRNSVFSKILVKNGDYSEPNEKLLGYLNFDFRLNPSLLHAVAKLHTGALIVDKEVVFALVTEAYSRAKSIDIHSETNLKSLPTPSNSIYGSLSVGVNEESDGNGTKRKLKIGSKTMNILVTMSVCLRGEQSLDIGPETSATIRKIHPSTARVFFRDEEIKRFLNIMQSPATYEMPRSVTSLRQLVSGFGDPSTFLPARAAHEEFENELLMPVSIFTLCDTPHNQGYGAAANSVAKLASRFLQALASSMLVTGPKPDFSSALHAFNTASSLRNLQSNTRAGSKVSKTWIVLSSFVNKLEKTLLQHPASSPSVLGSAMDFSSLADLAGQVLANGNQRVKTDVMNHLLYLYSDRQA